jgi:hypothetical protein
MARIAILIGRTVLGAALTTASLEPVSELDGGFAGRFWPIRQEPIAVRTGSTDKIGDEPGGQKRPAQRVAARRPPDTSKSSPILPDIGFAFLLSSSLRAATQPPIESRNRL